MAVGVSVLRCLWSTTQSSPPTPGGRAVSTPLINQLGPVGDPTVRVVEQQSTSSPDGPPQRPRTRSRRHRCERSEEVAIGP